MYVQLYPRIIADAKILSDRPGIEGTQVPVASLVGRVAAGQSIDDVAKEYNVTVEDVQAALEYAAQRVDENVPQDDSLAQLAGIIDSHDVGWAESCAQRRYPPRRFNG